MASRNKVTINEVARAAGVSIATVSRYLASPSSIRKENREKVEKIIKSMRYKPYVYARKLAGGKLGVYGLVIPGYEGIFYSFYALEIIRGIGLCLKDINKDLYLHIFWGDDRLNESLVDGIIFADILGNESQLRRILKEKIPCVVVNRRMDEVGVSYVCIDNAHGAFQAADYLIQHGHTRIAHIAGDVRTQSAMERLAGYKSAFLKNNLTIDDRYIKYANYSRPEARKSVEELFALDPPPTAIFAASDEMALEVYHCAQQHGMRIPEDLSLIGFDDNPLCAYEHLALTTVRQPLQEMAQAGVDILQNMVEGKAQPERKVLKSELIVRDTVTFAKQSSS